MVYNKVICILDVESLTYYLHVLKFTRFTQYIYKMQTTPNKVIINKL